MTKNFRTFIAFSAITLSMVALPAAGAALSMVRVTIPFAFTAGTTSLPAGEYLVSQMPGSQYLTIAGKAGEAILMAQPATPTADVNLSRLTFERTSKGNTLTVVSIGGSSSSLVRGKIGSSK